MTLVAIIKSNTKLKKVALRLMIPNHQYKPRLWVRWFLNPFKHRREKGSVVQRRTRMDLFPFHTFQLGKWSIVEDFATVNNGVGDVKIGDQTIIGMGCVLIGPLSIGDHVMLAQNIVISGLNHEYKAVNTPPSKQKINCKSIHIADKVWIGANSVITAGVSLGEHCVIGAGSVVTKDIPPYSVAVGNPAKVIKRYNFQTATWEAI